jgi:hypothetical protein
MGGIHGAPGTAAEAALYAPPIVGCWQPVIPTIAAVLILLLGSDVAPGDQCGCASCTCFVQPLVGSRDPVHPCAGDTWELSPLAAHGQIAHSLYGLDAKVSGPMSVWAPMRPVQGLESAQAAGLPGLGPKLCWFALPRIQALPERRCKQISASQTHTMLSATRAHSRSLWSLRVTAAIAEPARMMHQASGTAIHRWMETHLRPGKTPPRPWHWHSWAGLSQNGTLPGMQGQCSLQRLHC